MRYNKLILNIAQGKINEKRGGRLRNTNTREPKEENVTPSYEEIERVAEKQRKLIVVTRQIAFIIIKKKIHY